MSEFNPMIDIPRTDEEAESALRYGRKSIGETLVGIYQRERGLGKDVLDAYKTALLAHVDAYEKVYGKI